MTVPDLTEEALIDRLRRATIGRYDVYAELGAGGMATVFLALDLALDRKVAIKVMSPSLISSPGAIERFRREARVAAALSHPHIVPIHAIGEEPGLAYYVMKYIEGRSLDSVLRAEGQQDIAFAQSILGYVGGALQYAHQRGVVHRDVKPANIMLDLEGWCYVTDFGIAKAEHEAGLTKSGVIIGTPHYMCPEQFNGLPITGAADQYALGIVAFELLTGKPPYGGPSIGEVMRGHLLEPIPPVRSLRPEAPEAIEACVNRMLAKDPAERFASVAEAVAAFGTVSAAAERDTRAVIARLAEQGAEEQPSISVPTSPVLQRRPTVHHEAVSASTTPMATPVTTPAASPAASPPASPAASPARTRTLAPASATPQVERKPRRSRALILAGIGAVAIAGVSVWRAAGDAPLASVPAPTRVARAESTIVPPIAAEDTSARATVVVAPDTTPDTKPVAPARRPQSAPTVPATRAPIRNVRDRLEQFNDRRAAAGQPPIEAAMVRIGSRIPGAVLYVNGTPRGLIGQKPPQNVPVAAGRVQLTISAENCQSWDTTFTATAAERVVIGFRGPKC